MRSARLLVAAAVIVCGLSACGDDVHEPTESDRFNAYFYYPSGSDPGGEVYLGEMTGISACQSTARSFATSKNMTSRTGWSYICCRIANGSSCYDKHK